MRQAGGCNDYLLTPTFLNIYKILSTCSILKPTKTSNCSVTIQRPTEPLVTLAELKSIYSSSDASAEASKSIKLKVEQFVKEEDWQFEESVEHDYSMPKVQDCVLYCLTATLTTRIMNSVICIAC